MGAMSFGGPALIAAALMTSGASGGADERPLPAQPCQVGPIAVLEPDEDENFGAAIAAHDDLLVVGAPGEEPTAPGAAMVYRRRDGAWSLEAMLSAADAAAGARFGAAVATDGTRIAVGAPHDGAEAGAVYLFVEAARGWQQEQRLTETVPAAGARLGSALALDGDHLAAGAPRHSAAAPYGGAVLLAQRIGGTWVPQTLVFAADTATGHRLGTSVALAGGRLLAGAPYGGDRGEGAAYHLEIDPAGAALTRLTAPGAAPGSAFGASVALRDDLALVGAPQHSAQGLAAGAAWIFRADGDGWQEPHLLALDTAQARDRLGTAVALDHRGAWVSASERGEGSVISFRERGGWTAHVELRWRELESDVLQERAGGALAISGPQILTNYGRVDVWRGVAIFLVGECAGAPEPACSAAILQASLPALSDIAYDVAASDQLFVAGSHGAGLEGRAVARLRANDGTWLPPQMLLAADSSSGDSFGAALAAEGARVLVGAPGRNAPAGSNCAGGVYVFERAGDQLLQSALIEAPDSTACGRFGSVIALDGDLAVIGAPNQVNAPDVDVVHLFRRVGNQWTAEAALTREHGDGHDQFGSAVAVDQPYVLVGAEGDDSASLFRRGADGWHEIQRLEPADPRAPGNFGRSVAISLPRLAVGSSSGGRVETFREQAGAWTRSAIITRPTPFGFGNSLALDGDRLLVGWPFFRRAVLFGAAPGGWVELVELPYHHSVENFYAEAVVLHGTMAAVSGGVPLASITGPFFSGFLYRTGSLDCNANGVVDGCEIAHGLLADTDGDGVPDICESAAGDLNGDGAAGIDDLIALLLAWGPCPPDLCLADLDGDGDVDVDDLLIALLSWSP